MNFILRDRYPYPVDNQIDFEYFVIRNIGKTKIPVLPVTWTNYYKVAKYGKDASKMQLLQDYVNKLSGKYFTVVQWDDGLMTEISHLDCQIFSMGKNIGYPLPLISTPHTYRYNLEKDIFCSFVGNNTHSIRKQIFELKTDYYITDKKHHLKDYCKVLARSIFGLCPRGYGQTSFRIMECLQYGAIPVYVSDGFILPHNVDFNTYGVVINSDQVFNIPKILSKFTKEEIEQKREIGKEVYKKYYTYNSNLEIIRSIVNK